MQECRSAPPNSHSDSDAAVSPLRHLAAIQIRRGAWTPLNNESLHFLAHHAPNLTSLCCSLTLTPDGPLVLPAKLKALDLQLNVAYTDAAINGMLKTLAALPYLSRLCLKLAVFAEESTVDLELLGACPSLTDLSLQTFYGSPPNLSDKQMDQIRSSLGHLRRFFIVRWKHSEELERLLVPTVNARWQDIGPVRVDERTGELLVKLQTLTTLHLSYTMRAAHVDFLSQLPRLTALSLLHCVNLLGTRSNADALLASLVLCNGLTELSLQCGFDSAHCSALFVKLTSIKKLEMGGGLDTLQC